MLVYTVSRLFLRHSIVLFYLRIFTTGNPKPIIIGTMVANTLLCVVIFCLMAFQCRPISLFWTRWDLQSEGYCLPERSVYLSSVIVSLLMDIWVLALPFPYLTRLQLPLRKRLGIALTLASGSVLVIIFSILKLLAINSMENSANKTGKTNSSIFHSGYALDHLLTRTQQSCPRLTHGQRSRLTWASSAHACPESGC